MDTIIFIPAYVHVDDVGSVCTVLCGNCIKDFEWKELNIDCSCLSFSDPCGNNRLAVLNYNSTEFNLCGHYMLSSQYDFFWISLGRKLIEVFGGHINYKYYDVNSSHGGIRFDYSVLPENALLNIELCDEDRCVDREHIIKDLNPLSADELEFGASYYGGKNDDFKKLYDKFIEVEMKYLGEKIEVVKNHKKRRNEKV